MVTAAKFKHLVLLLDNVVEQPHFEKQSYWVKKKILPTLNEEKMQAVIKLDEIEQSVYCAIDKTIIYPVAGAWGKQGWTMIELAKVSTELLTDALKTAHHIVSGASPAGKT